MENRDTEVTAAYPIECRGAYRDRFIEKPVTASLTIFQSGVRELGCPFISRRETRDRSDGSSYKMEFVCRAVDWRAGVLLPEQCVHLRPVKESGLR